MKKIALIVLVVSALSACNEAGKTPGQKLDTLLKKVDTTADQFVDSSKSKFKQLKDKVDHIDIHIGSDSAKKDTSKH